VATALGALALAWMISWVYEGGYSHLTKKRFLFALCVLAAVALFGHAYIRHQWLRYVRESALKEVTAFVSRSQDLDSASSAAVGLIQEVELVSRGYRMYVAAMQSSRPVPSPLTLQQKRPAASDKPDRGPKPNPTLQ